MEGLDARALLAGGAELRAAEDLQPATHEWWRFTTTSVLQLGLMVQGHELAGLDFSSGQSVEARPLIDVPNLSARA
jgi:hypothetical protein